MIPILPRITEKLGIRVHWRRLFRTYDYTQYDTHTVQVRNTYVCNTTQPLTPPTTNRSYDQNFLKTISNQTTITTSGKYHFELHVYIFRWRIPVVILWQQGDLSESLSTFWSVYIPPNFVFSAYDQVFWTCPVRARGESVLEYQCIQSYNSRILTNLKH
jgi:hypothetical protein